MERSLRRSLISAYFARQATAETFGPTANLDADGRTRRRRSLDAAFEKYRTTLVVGAGADWPEALEDAAERGWIDLLEHDGNPLEARDAIWHGSFWDFVATPNGVAILCAP